MWKVGVCQEIVQCYRHNGKALLLSVLGPDRMSALLLIHDGRKTFCFHSSSIFKKKNVSEFFQMTGELNFHLLPKRGRGYECTK